MDRKHWGICPVCGGQDMKVMDVQAALLASFPIEAANMVGNFHFKWFRPWDKELLAALDGEFMGLAPRFKALLCVVMLKVNGEVLSAPIHINPTVAAYFQGKDLESFASFVARRIVDKVRHSITGQIEKALIEKLRPIIEGHDGESLREALAEITESGLLPHEVAALDD